MGKSALNSLIFRNLPVASTLWPWEEERNHNSLQSREMLGMLAMQADPSTLDRYAFLEILKIGGRS